MKFQPALSSIVDFLPLFAAVNFFYRSGTDKSDKRLFEPRQELSANLRRTYFHLAAQSAAADQETSRKDQEWRNVGYWRDLGQALASYARRSIRDDMPSSLKELIALERALGVQLEAIGERCVSLWGKGS